LCHLAGNPDGSIETLTGESLSRRAENETLKRVLIRDAEPVCIPRASYDVAIEGSMQPSDGRVESTLNRPAVAINLPVINLAVQKLFPSCQSQV
jgi:hypothetical protein